MRTPFHRQTGRGALIAAGIAFATITVLNCLVPANSARAQSRDWTSRFLPQRGSSDEVDTDDVEERERGRYYRNLVRDENEVRREVDHLRTLSRNARSFSSGSGSAAQQAAFEQLLRQVGAREQVAVVLQESIPELDADNFTAHPFREIVQTDGDLVEPPLALQLGRTKSAYAAVQSAWSEVANCLTTDPPTTPDTNPLSRAFTRWKSAHRAHSDSRALTAGGLAVHAYFTRADELLKALDNGEDRDALSVFLLYSGFPFPGGTVGDLVRHVLDFNLTVRIGSPAHVVLARLTQEMLLEVEADLAVLEDRIEYYKQQTLASEGNPGAGNARSRGGQPASAGTPSLPRRTPTEEAAPADDPPVPMQRMVDDPFRRRGR